MKAIDDAVHMNRHVGEVCKRIRVDGVSAEALATMDQVDFGADTRKIQHVAKRRVTAPHHHGGFPTEEPAVARRAV